MNPVADRIALTGHLGSDPAQKPKPTKEVRFMRTQQAQPLKLEDQVGHTTDRTL